MCCEAVPCVWPFGQSSGRSNWLCTCEPSLTPFSFLSPPSPLNVLVVERRDHVLLLLLRRVIKSFVSPRQLPARPAHRLPSATSTPTRRATARAQLCSKPELYPKQTTGICYTRLVDDGASTEVTLPPSYCFSQTNILS